MSRATVRTPVQRFHDGVFTARPDTVAGEEPLEIRVDGRSLTVTMRTPGHDVELAHGLLHAEGVIAAAADVRSARYCQGSDVNGHNTYNVLDVELAAPPLRPLRAGRAFVTNSACGVCGTSSLAELGVTARYQLRPDGPVFDPQVIMGLPAALGRQQQTFARTGGVHASALVGPDGGLDIVREDVGRHNAMDKVIGAALLAGLVPLTDHALLTSSRASYELVAKAITAGVGVLIAVSAPSSMAVQLAQTAGLTLLGFTRATGFNLYAGGGRVAGATC